MTSTNIYYKDDRIRRRQKYFTLAIVLVIMVIVWYFAGTAILADVPDAVLLKPPVMVFMDSGTGCQYLVADNGGIMPRMDANGFQVCDKTITPKGSK